MTLTRTFNPNASGVSINVQPPNEESEDESEEDEESEDEEEDSPRPQQSFGLDRSKSSSKIRGMLSSILAGSRENLSKLDAFKSNLQTHLVRRESTESLNVYQ